MDNWWWVRPLQAQIPLGSSALCGFRRRRDGIEWRIPGWWVGGGM